VTHFIRPLNSCPTTRLSTHVSSSTWITIDDHRKNQSINQSDRSDPIDPIDPIDPKRCLITIVASAVNKATAVSNHNINNSINNSINNNINSINNSINNNINNNIHNINININMSQDAAPQVSGMALDIRQASEQETFDLAGCNPQTLQTLVRDAFGEPLSADTVQLPRITLITGAGKLGRQKYDAGCAKIVVSGLMELGYIEDKGASAILECAGTYKSQHDTNKNLKTVVVFPKVVVLDSANGGDGGDGDGVSGPPLLDPSSPEYRIVTATNKNILERMMDSKCPSWSQKKVAVTVLDDLMTKLHACDEKLMHGTPLTDKEQDYYDTVSAPSLTNKQDVIKELMHAQVDVGKITAVERTQLLSQVQERLQIMDKELAAADAENKPKLKEKLLQKRAKVLEREEKLAAIVPVSPLPLKLQGEINKLRAEAVPLQKVQDAGAGRLLSIKESQTVSKLLELLAEIEVLEQDSRGWFEEDDAFDARLQASRRAASAAAAAKSKKNTKSGSGGGGGSSSKSNLPSAAKWVTPGGTAAAKAKKAAAAKPKATRGGGVFGAMMMDSDSD
jgi:hypothetical protein